MHANYFLPKNNGNFYTLIDTIYGNSIDYSSTIGNIVFDLSDPDFAQFMPINDLKIDYTSANYYVYGFNKLNGKNSKLPINFSHI